MKISIHFGVAFFFFLSGMSSPYIIENGLRSVQPFFLHNKIHPKRRWVGRTIFDIFQSEFNEPSSIIEYEMTNKLIYIQTNRGRPKNTQEIIEGYDLLKNRPLLNDDVIFVKRHKHEPSVKETTNLNLTDKYPSQAKTKIRIVFEDDSLLVISKPSGIPTHPSGNFHYNSVTEILKSELGLENIWPCHRLDKVTSGILILAKDRETSIKYQTLIQQGQSKKYYYAKVKGKFPSKEVMVNCPIFSINSCGVFLIPSNSTDIPINSTTIFELLKYDEITDTSVVICKPITGKMHQIRIHLRNMNFPIVDDHKYNPINEDIANFPIMYANNNLEQHLYRKVFEKYPEFNKFQDPDSSIVENNETINVDEITGWNSDPIILKQTANIKQKRDDYFKQLRSSYNQICDVCHRKLMNERESMLDQEIMLHSFKYECKGDVNFDYIDVPPIWTGI